MNDKANITNGESGASEEAELIQVEVAYALPEKQFLQAVSVPSGATMYDAVIKSGVLDKFPEIDPDTNPMGIFGKAERKPKARVLAAGERIELYRPLQADPKEVRKKRAAAAKAKRSGGEAG